MARASTTQSLATVTYLLLFTIIGWPVVAVLEMYSRGKGGGVSFVGGHGNATWTVPCRMLKWRGWAYNSRLLSVIEGAALGAWFANIPVEEIPTWVARAVALVFDEPVQVPSDSKIVRVPPSSFGWLWGGLYVIKSENCLYVGDCDVMRGNHLDNEVTKVEL